MRKLFGSYNKKSRPSERPLRRSKKRLPRFLMKRTWNQKYVLYLCIVSIGAFFITAALRVILGGVHEDATARAEYEHLRAEFPVIFAQDVPEENIIPPPPDDVVEALSSDNVDEDGDELEEEDNSFYLRDLSLNELAGINRDFIGWLNVGNSIDYPVVRGSDNEKYINTTFTGRRNSAGAIFMDYRHSDGFNEHVHIIYGHYTRDGTMFSPLARYLDNDYLQRNRNITVTTRDGRTLDYRIFAAKLTDAWDTAYTVGIREPERASEVFPNAPANASRFMLLSTCTRSANDDERILVFAALVS